MDVKTSDFIRKKCYAFELIRIVENLWNIFIYMYMFWYMNNS